MVTWSLKRLCRWCPLTSTHTQASLALTCGIRITIRELLSMLAPVMGVCTTAQLPEQCTTWSWPTSRYSACGPAAAVLLMHRTAHELATRSAWYSSRKAVLRMLGVSTSCHEDSTGTSWCLYRASTSLRRLNTGASPYLSCLETMPVWARMTTGSRACLSAQAAP